MCAHSDEHGPDQAGKDRVLRFKHAFDLVPAVSGRIETGSDEIRNLERPVAFYDLLPAAGYGRVKQAERD